jgi:hypothetical protein
MPIYVFLVPALLLAFLGWYFGKLRAVRMVMAGSIILGSVTLPSELYVNRYLNSLGCEGNWMKGLSCPEWSVLINLAIWHHGSALLFFTYLMVIFPFVCFASAFAETIFRIRKARLSQSEK